MKYVIVICLCLVLLLSACGGREDPQGSEPETTADASNESTGAATSNAKALAESCINKSVQDLYAKIGQPKSSDYAPSCNGGEGAEDGNLYYDGFIVYTLKEGNKETVVFVE